MKKRRIVSLLLAAAILAAALTGCANLKVGLMLLQHATGPYDPMDQVMEDRLNAILEAAVAQDAAAIKAQLRQTPSRRSRSWIARSRRCLRITTTKHGSLKYPRPGYQNPGMKQAVQQGLMKCTAGSTERSIISFPCTLL